MKVVPTKKMFYKIYPYKARIRLCECPHVKEIIEIPVNQNHYLNPTVNIKYIEKSVNIGLSDDALSKTYQIDNLSKGDFEVRCKTVKTPNGDDYLMEVYVKNEEFLNKIIKNFNVYEVHKPISSNHESLLGNEKVIVRKNLYWNTFKYKISLNWRTALKMTYDKKREMIDFINTGFEHKVRSALDSYTKSVYFEHEDDVILFKMAYGEEIDSIEKVITYDEV